ncbi:hypothetical protein [Candidatus Cardinium hertigii]|uniref:Uncharacterized protein n=1 Tax=Candidatus Cardinium hertigii TaxID=247481 RepID=A0A3N2QAX8_9BACT|nr:hypothetical protein [Candidatus Cardinium hertigii]ROT46956.1 hypothetical protein EDM02_05260 [Candidatus Cardinium hertigii]
MKDIWLCSTTRKGIAASTGIHLFFIGLMYYIQFGSASDTSNGPSYTIAIKPAKTYTVPETIDSVEKTHQTQNAFQDKEPVQASTIQEAKPNKPSTIVDNTQKKQFSPRQQKHAQTISSGKKATQKSVQVQKNEVSKIDKRGLYNIGKGNVKQTGATLELTGWEWDTVPDPKDHTEECGKIVFEIKVDENGEIISIQTIEKTVSPIVEKIYSDALRGLTFNKTSEIQSYSSVSTGKVSFILVSK